jgi:hypothetical protein
MHTSSKDFSEDIPDSSTNGGIALVWPSRRTTLAVDSTVSAVLRARIRAQRVQPARRESVPPFARLTQPPDDI